MIIKPPTEAKQRPFGPLSREVVLTAVHAMQRLRKLDSQSLVTKDSDVEKQTARALLNNVLIQNADEFLGTWLTMNAEYTPLVQGIAALLRRAVSLNEQEAAQRYAAQQAHAAKANVDASNESAATATNALAQRDAEIAAAAVTQGEAPVNVVSASFGEATKPGSPVE